jgi:hypothetical protein
MRFNSKKPWTVLFLMVLFITSCSTKADDSALLDALADAEEAEEARDEAIEALEETTDALEEATDALEAVTSTTEAATTTETETETTTEVPECAGDELPDGITLDPSEADEGDVDGDGYIDQIWAAVVDEGSSSFTAHLVVLMGDSDDRYHVLEIGGGLMPEASALAGGDADGNGAQEVWLRSPDVRRTSPAGLAVFSDCALVKVTNSETGYSWILRGASDYQPMPPFSRASCQIIEGTTVYSQIKSDLEGSDWNLDISPVRLEGIEMVPATELVTVPEGALSGTFSSFDDAFDYAADYGFEESSCS